MDLTKTAKDAALITIGFGVIGFQRAQVLRNELTRNLADNLENLSGNDRLQDVRSRTGEARGALGAQLAEARVELGRIALDLDAAFEPVRRQVDAALDELQGRLPEPVQGAVKQAREVAATAREQVKSLVAA